MITLSLANGLTLMITSSLIQSNSDTINSGSGDDVDDGSGDCDTIIVAFVMADTACIRVSVCRQLTSFTYYDDSNNNNNNNDDDDDDDDRSDNTANRLTLCNVTVSKCTSNEGTSTTSSLSESLSITR